MNNKKFLTSYELLETTTEMVEESKQLNSGKIILRGIIQRADVLNQNGRIYPRAILEREVRNYQKMIIENRALGELDHPADSVVSLKNVSHIMREVRMESDGTVMGAIELLSTDAGKTAKALVADGVKLGISSRGVGSTKRQGEWTIVEEDFQLITFDLVSEPSTPAAFLLPEGRVIVHGNELKNFFTKSDRINRVINDLLHPIGKK